MITFLITAGIVSFFCLGQAMAEDWSQFRGPNGSGVSNSVGLPVQLGVKKNLLWRTPLLPGHSSPVLAGNRVFLTGFEGKKLWTICLDRLTGKVLWRREAPRPRIEEYEPPNTPASTTPVTDGKNVYVFFGDFGLLCYGLDGKEVWRLPLGPFNNINGHGSSPILADDKLVLLCDQDTGSYLLALNKHNGRVLWKAERPEITRGYATPGIFHLRDGSAELVVPGAFQLISYSLENGKKLWWVRGMAWQLKSVPLIRGGMIYVSSWEPGGDTERSEEVPPFEEVLKRHDANGDGKLSIDEAPERLRSSWKDEDLDHDGSMDERDWNFYRARMTSQNSLVAIRHGGRGDLTDTNVAWRYRKSLPNVPSPLIYKDILYLVKDGGIVTSLNPMTGQVLKQARLPGAAEHYWASPVAADDKIYMISEVGKVSVLKAGGEWEILAVNDLNEECFATPAIAERTILVRTREALYCFGQRH